MKFKFILLLPLFFLGCSKDPAKQDSSAAVKSASQIQQPTQQPIAVSLPFQIAVVETAETKEQNEIKEQAAKLLEDKNYDALDELANKYRASKECYANGVWKLFVLYSGLNVPNEKRADIWQNRAESLKAWRKAKPGSITARVALADFLTAYAWNARGGGYAGTVTDEGWRLFSARLIEAAETLKNASALTNKCPYWGSVMLRTALGLQFEKPVFKKLFDEAVQSEPAYTGYYNRNAIYLLPRWYGEEGEWEASLTQSADQLGGEEGDLLYARVVSSMREYGAASSNIFKECKLSWQRVNKGFEVMEKQFPNSLAAKSEHAHLAALAGDAYTARKCFDQLEGKVDLSVWRSENHFLEFANWTYAH